MTSDYERGAPRALERCEETLAEICAEILSVSPTTRRDDIFSLGATSIDAVRVVAAARRRGYDLRLVDLLENHSIGALALVAANRPLRALAESVARGTMRLTPHQQAMFGIYEDLTAATVPFAVFVPNAIGPETVQVALAALMDRHDVSRVSIERDGDHYVQSFADNCPVRDVKVVTVTGPDVDVTMWERVRSESAHVPIDVAPMCRVTYYIRPAGERPLVHIVFNHLVFDGVSRFIWLSDLDAALTAAAAGQTPRWPAPADSYFAWCRWLETYAATADQEAAAAAWEARLAGGSVGIRSDHDHGPNLIERTDRVVVELSVGRTEQFIGACTADPSVSPEGLVLMTLAASRPVDWLSGRFLTFVATHGRAVAESEVDVSGIVGCLYSLYPFALPALESGGVDERGQARRVSSSIAAMAEVGPTFEWLRRLGSGSTRLRLDGLPVPEVVFSYHGTLFNPAPWQNLEEVQIPAGAGGVRCGPRNLAFQLAAAVVDERLRIVCTYGVDQHERETVEAWLNRAVEMIDRIVEGAS